ncbi:MAG: hypothetical protein ACJ8CR_02810 [Roseiflexaceae bacterium]
MTRPSRVMLLAVVLVMALGEIAPVSYVARPPADATAAPCAWLYGVRLWQASFRFSYRYKATFGSGDTATTDAAAIFTTLLTADPGAAAPALDWHAPVGQAGQGFVTEHWQETQKGAVSVVDSGSDSPAYVPALGPRVESTVAYLHTDPQGCSYTLDFGAKLTRVTIHYLQSGSTGVYPLVIGIAGLDSPHVVPASAETAHPPTLGGSAVLRVPQNFYGGTGDRFAVAHGDAVYGDPNATADVSWMLTPYPGNAPVLQLDPELFERNTFLDQVSVEDTFNGDVTWNNERGGHVTWQLGAAPPTQSADTTDTVVPDPIDVGRQPVGSTPLSAQARSIAGRESAPATTQIQTVSVPKWAGSIGAISVSKKGKTVEYQFQFTFPKPAFTAETTVPSVIPFFGGNPLSIEKGQVSASATVNSSGEGSAKGQGSIGFAAMGQGPLLVKAALEAALTLDAPDGPMLDAQEAVLPLARTNAVTLTSILAPARLGLGRHLLYWHILPSDTSAAATEPISSAVSAAAVLPDLFTTPSQIVVGPVVNATAPITIAVMNQGPEASNGGTLMIYDGLPGQASTHALVTLPFPPIAAGGSAAVQGMLHFGIGTPAGGISPTLYVQLDPNQLIDELDASNNLVRVGGSLKASPGRVYLPLVRR